MLNKRYFNMVEVMLAIVVISLGLSSVFVLFPAGLSAHKNAAADNSIADLAELVISGVRAQINMDTASGSGFGTWADVKDEISDVSGNNAAGVGDDSQWEVPELLKSGKDDHDKIENASLLRSKNKKNIFLVRQMSGPEDERFVDFSAIARVYVDTDSMTKEFFYIAKDNAEPKYMLYEKVGKVNMDDVLLPLVLELSYPAEVPYEEREKSYFRFEIFNEHYVLPTQGTP